MPEVYQNRSS